MKRKKEIVLLTAGFFAAGVIAFRIILMLGYLQVDCPISYLNPWQYFIQCSLYHSLFYLAIFIVSIIMAISTKKIASSKVS